jgi:hypothetical protein
MDIRPYNKLSREYSRLYDILSDGEYEVAAYVDHISYVLDRRTVSRTICTIKKVGNLEIYASSRGVTYGCLDSFFDTEDEQANEKEMFITMCEKLNLEWIV